MDSAETVSTSATTAECSPIILRQTEQVRLTFLPTLVENAANPKAGINGAFVYQKKGKGDIWESAASLSLGTVKKGEAYKLELHSAELLTLVEALGPLYRLVWGTGVPQGKKMFVKVEAGLERFLQLNEAEFRAFLDTHAEDAAKTLKRLFQWLALSPKLPQILDQLASIAPSEVPPLSALLGLSSLKSAYVLWKNNMGNVSEEFWQKSLTERAFVLSQVFSYPVILLQNKAYLGGKTLGNKAGSVIDFLFQSASTGALLLMEIKTPGSPLLGTEYRAGVYPPSADLSGAVSQALHYRQNLMKHFHSLVAETGSAAVLGEPRIVVLTGNASTELDTQSKRESFELYRHRLEGVTVVTFDELFARLEDSITLMESAPSEA